MLDAFVRREGAANSASLTQNDGVHCVLRYFMPMFRRDCEGLQQVGALLGSSASYKSIQHMFSFGDGPSNHA